MGAFYDSLENLNGNVWSFSDTRTLYKHTQNSIEIKPNPNETTSDFANSWINLRRILGSSNKLPQSYNVKIAIDKNKFTDDSKHILLPFFVEKASNISDTDLFITSIALYITPHSNNIQTRVTFNNPVEEKGYYISLQDFTVNEDLWNNEIELGLKINDKLEIESYVNKSNMYSGIFNSQTIKFGARFTTFFISNNSTLNISEITFDNTDQEIYDFENLKSL